ncbi:nucleotidyltransferase family protein [Candidatus Calescamantes bacterium]|nr:nucleotidyltransferase family protein [Candidatus Calescamantes bacterium]
MTKIEKIKKILAEYKPMLSKEFKVKEIGLFGSYLRGEERPNSDLDIVVTFSQPVSLLDLVKLENYLTSLTGIKVDVVPKKDIRPELKKEILGQEIYV